MNDLEGIIFKTQSYTESSRLLHTYTKKGKTALLARGAQNMNNKDRILAQYLTRISFKYTKFRGFMPLYNGVIINDYNDIKSDYNKVKEASLILELLDKTTFADEDHEKIYVNAIKALNHKDILTSSLSFAVKLLYYLGFGINLKGDGRKVKGINISLGSIVYSEENETVDLSYNDTVLLLKLTYTDIDNLESFDKEFLTNIKKFLYLYYGYHLNIKIKALE